MRRLVRHAVGGAGVVAVAVGALGLGAGAQELSEACANHANFSVIGRASAVSSVVSAPNRSVVSTVDSSLPGAQAAVDSVEGSKGWAGAPYVPVAAENAGQAKLEANQIPVFATSDSATTPEASNSTPAATVSAKSTDSSSTARAEGGGPGTAQGGAGRAIAKAEASCATDGSLHAAADTSADATTIGGVLRLGSVVSHALVERAPDGTVRKVESTMAVEGATVQGQAVAISDKGLVVGPSATPLPGNPLLDALRAAGITVRYLAADIDRNAGEVTAPGLEVSVTAPVPGGDPVTTTYTFGKAMALAALTPGDPAPASNGDDFATPAAGATAPEVGLPDASVAAPDQAPPAPSAPPVAPKAALATAELTPWSVAPAYSALGVGALLLLAWLLFEKIAVRFPWK